MEAKPKEAARLRIPELGRIVEWSNADKCLLVALVNITSSVSLGLTLWHYRDNPTATAYAEPGVIALLYEIACLFAIVWLLIAALSIYERRNNPQSIVPVHLEIQVYAVTNAWVGYMVGMLTSPYGVLVFLGGLFVSAVLFGRFASVMGMVSFFFVAFGASILERLRVIPYAPALASAPYEHHRLAESWSGTMGLIFVSILIMIIMVFIGLVGSWDRRQADLAAANAELKERSRAKDEFLSMVSHELRTPLTALMGAVGLLEAYREDPERSAELMHIARENGTRLSALVNDLLDLRSMSSGNFEVTLARLEPVALVEGAIGELGAVFQEKGLRIETGLAAAHGKFIAGDSVRLQQVLLNLLYNATKFSPAKGCIRVEAQLAPGGKHLRLSVLDEGPGIAPADLENVFEKFYQGKPPVGRAQPGTGLGLSIARGIIEAHHGTIHAANRSKRGAVFSFEIPLWGDPATQLAGSGDPLLSAPRLAENS